MISSVLETGQNAVIWKVTLALTKLKLIRFIDTYSIGVTGALLLHQVQFTVLSVLRITKSPIA
jgi:hypothetical protein